MPLTGLPSSLIAVNAVRLSDKTGLQEVLLLDRGNGMIHGRMPSVYPKSSRIEFKSDSERIGPFVNSREVGFNNNNLLTL